MNRGIFLKKGKGKSLELSNLLLSIAFFTFIGANVLYLMLRGWKEINCLEGVAISFGLGIGCVTLEMLFFYILNMRFDIGIIALPWIILIAVNIILFFSKENKAELFTSGTKEFGLLDILLSFAIIFEVSYAFFRAFIKPIESYDAVAIYAIKSKIFFLARSIPHDFFAGLVNNFPHPDYPLNIPLAESFIYLFLGNLNDQLVKIIFPIYFVCILVVLYFAIRRFASRSYALIFIFILASIPQFNAYAANAYLDLPLSFYILVSALFLFRWFEDRNKIQFIIVSSVMAGLAGWTKNEGVMYCAAYIAMIILFLTINFRKISRKDLSCLFLYIMVIVMILAPWLYIKSAAHLTNTDVGKIDTGLRSLGNDLYKLKTILYEFQKQIFGPKKWNILWIVLFLSIIFNLKSALRGVRKYIALYLAIIISGYILIYMIAPIDVTFFVKKTWSRFLLHFLPIVIYWLSLMLKDDIKL